MSCVNNSQCSPDFECVDGKCQRVTARPLLVMSYENVVVGVVIFLVVLGIGYYMWPRASAPYIPPRETARAPPQPPEFPQGRYQISQNINGKTYYLVANQANSYDGNRIQLTTFEKGIELPPTAVWEYDPGPDTIKVMDGSERYLTFDITETGFGLTKKVATMRITRDGKIQWRDIYCMATKAWSPKIVSTWLAGCNTESGTNIQNDEQIFWTISYLG